MSNLKKLQFLARVQEYCNKATDADEAYKQVEYLAQAYADENDIRLHETLQMKDQRKRTILHYSCRSLLHDEGELIRRLLGWFPDAETLSNALKLKDKDGRTCLMVAVQNSDSVLAERRTLIILGASGAGSKLGLVRSKAGATALHYAAGAGGTARMIQALWDNGKVALRTFALHGGTPLHWACSSSKDVSVTIRALVRCGADVNASRAASSESGPAVPPSLALALAVGNDTNACTLLETENISVETMLSIGNTTLFHLAAQQGLHASLEMMLAKLEDEGVLEHKDKKGLTALHVAKKHKHEACVKLLCSRGKPKEAFLNIGGEKVSSLAEPATNQGISEREAPATTAEAKLALEGWKNVMELTKTPTDRVVEALACKSQGNGHFQRKEWQQAHDCYTQALLANPKEGTYYCNRSACLIQLGDASAALVDAILAQKLKPAWTKAYYRQAVALLNLGRHQDAALAAYEGLKLEPANAALQRLLRACVSQGRDAFQKSKGKQET